jgi:hypothetical protein
MVQTHKRRQDSLIAASIIQSADKKIEIQIIPLAETLNFMNKIYGLIIKYYLFISLVLIFSISTDAQKKTEMFPVEKSNGEWYVDSPGRASDAKFEDFLGRQALILRNNTHVIRSGIEFTDGTIEFDLSPTDKGHFTAVTFRRESVQNHENIYFRAHKSGKYDAMQYAPRINGSSTWQVYPEFTSLVDLPRNQWTHVRIEVQGTRMEVYVNSETKPVLVVPRLRHDSTKGEVGFWARVNDQPHTWATALSNISIRPSRTLLKSETVVRPAPPTGTLSSWEVSAPVKHDLPGIVTLLPEPKDWRKIIAEESGLINLNRAVGFQRGRHTVFARTNIKTVEAKTVLLELGYSDDVVVFLNGESIYFGINGWESRYPEYMGFVKPGFENIFLKLRAGNNELVLAVSDDQRFGWGFNARLKEQ